ncbi:hypothetical protein EQH57_0939 [Dictyocoela roeselum]|nr:hypothetical protein EQH57_0939 [Dictyocoela roeselum]
MENLIVDKITEFLKTNRLIDDFQHGFRHNRSCLMNLIIFFRYIIKIHDIKSPIDIIYLDFQKTLIIESPTSAYVVNCTASVLKASLRTGYNAGLRTDGSELYIKELPPLGVML